MFAFHVMCRVFPARMRINIAARSVQRISHTRCRGHHTASKVARGATSRLQLTLLVRLVRHLALTVKVLLILAQFVTRIVPSQSSTTTNASKVALTATQLSMVSVKDVRAHARTAWAPSLIASRVTALMRGGIFIRMPAMRSAHLTPPQSQATWNS